MMKVDSEAVPELDWLGGTDSGRSNDHEQQNQEQWNNPISRILSNRTFVPKNDVSRRTGFRW